MISIQSEFTNDFRVFFLTVKKMNEDYGFKVILSNMVDGS